MDTLPTAITSSRTSPKTCIAFGGPIDTQEVNIIGKRLEVLVGEKWGIRYIYDYMLVNQRIVAVFAGVERSGT